MNDGNISIKETTVDSTAEASYEPGYEAERNKPMPSFNHGALQMQLGASLYIKYAAQFKIVSEVKLALPNVDPAVPDISIFPKMPIDWLNDEIQVTEPPLTVIEILSPKQSVDDIKNKIFNIYFPGGVKSAWLVIPTLRSIHIFSPDRTYKTYNSGKLRDIVTGIELDIDKVFSN